MEERQKDINEKHRMPRRSLLKALAGIPLLGLFSFAAFKKINFDKEKRYRVIRELGLEDLKAPSMLTTSSGKGDLLRLGFIGFGSRAGQLSQSLGFMHPDDVKQREMNGTLEGWLQQTDLNVAITGICDVFDLHAEQGLAVAGNKTRPGGSNGPQLPVKRYKTYQDLLNDSEIDAVIVATPDHHHARITTDAIRAGKHVYCEKSICRTEEELYEVYDTVRNSDRVFQLGHQITQNVVFQQAKEIIKRDILGKITLIETTTNRNTADGAWIRHLDENGNPKPGDESSIDWKQWLGSRPYKPFSTDRFYNWTKWFDYDMGMIGQLFTHEYDAVNQLLRIGIPASAVTSGGIYYWKDNREIPDVLHAVFEYPEKEMTLTYSADLASSRQRGRVFNGHDASMELGGSLSITADGDSTKYREQLDQGIIDVSVPMITISPGTGGDVDAVTSATEKYYASRGLTTTNINGIEVDVTHLHIKEWIDCIRNGGETSANIERAFEEGVTCVMANKSYLEKRRVEWDPVNRRIV
ncbi:MAG: Gfo/Idh/MocA family oxidoreductase [Bacteroidota bacterium]